MHLKDEQLRAVLDDELDGAERAAVDVHLAACEECRRRANELAAQAQRIQAHLAALEPEFQSPKVTSPQLALARFKAQRTSHKKEFPMLQQLFSRRFRLAWGAVALVALLAVSMTFPPVRTWAEGVLAQFRVSRVTVVSVDPSRFSELGVGSTLSKQINTFLSDSLTVTKKTGSPKTAANAAQASQMAGFTVRLPSNRTDAPQLTVQDGAAFQFVVNRARAQTLLNEAGASNLQLPASIDGALIKVNIPSAVSAGYGTCPKLEEDSGSAPRTSESSAVNSSAKGSPGRVMINCILLIQIPSPTVDTPPDLDVQQIAELGLQFTGMTKEQAHAYAQTVDWTSTLVIPIPRNAAQYKQVNVDGVTGYLIQRPTDDAPQYVIVWVKNGIVYAIGGLGNDTTTALSMAGSLK